MSAAIAERIKIIDTDTHVTEPGDLWTSRVSKKWGDLVPHQIQSSRGRPRWVIGGKLPPNLAAFGEAERKEGEMISRLVMLGETDKASWDPHERLVRMDEFGTYANIIYPNVGGFGSGRFLDLGEPELMLECVRAYNDFLTDWCAADRKRLIAITALPFWDVAASVAEIERCAKKGHKGVLFGAEPEVFGQPLLADPHWSPIWEKAQDLGQPINFHIGAGDIFGGFSKGFPGNGPRANYAKFTTGFFLDNYRSIAEVIVSGICHRYPRLNFVSVESGISWIPFLLRSLDWQWLSTRVPDEHPEYDLLPSEYFRRQIYGCFWFERAEAVSAIELYPDNFFFETDFPHPTSQAPGPSSPEGKKARDYVEEVLVGLPEENLRKVLHDNAARVYRLD